MSYQEKNNKIKQNQNKQRKGGIQEEAEEGFGERNSDQLESFFKLKKPITLE